MNHTTLPKVLSINIVKARVDGKPGKRAQLVLNTGECQYAAERRREKRKACEFCAFHDQKPSEHGIPFGDAIHMATNVARVDAIELLMSGGSLLDQRQVAKEQLGELLGLIPQSQIRTVLLESRPEFITNESLLFVLRHLTTVQNPHQPMNLEVAIGVETYDDHIRCEELGKGFAFNKFLAAAGQITANGATPVAYLLTGLPMFDETSARHDLFRAAMKIDEFSRLFGQLIPGYRYPTSSPVRICIESFFPVEGVTTLAAGSYLTPAFVAGVVRGIMEKFGLEIYIATSSENTGAQHPLTEFKQLFERFNESQDIRHLDAIIRGRAE
ncbi:Uncharacterised protein [Candidatus Bilamarchaeum dharawalense]|uniref:Elp3/MiaA/NifB-like radical SAM core domain-containing protein n=1 Tax=Candidatus Bilamarchaeum dharawalense TaxID=2885759 RepID=A0A5E4LPK8_9ARCH|nr:Uncharacterised protein [Candidatus Bilamarchaeum dharawalense]